MRPRPRAHPGETRGARPTGLADPMRDFYDRHPYPPPTTDLERYRRRWQDPQRRRSDYHLLWPRHPYLEEQTILVAGCGTSQAAKYAIRQAAAEVTGIDISAASLDHTKKLQRRHGLTNLELHELPIERVHELGCSFDRIVCTGVLHHLADPDAGLRALRTVLKPDGAIHLMVYAPFGRVGIYMLQEYCRRLGVRGSDAEIQDLAAMLGMLPRNHPLTHVLRSSPDFDDPHGLADALLNPRDRAYSVPQLFDFIERNGLSFGRWHLQAQYLPQCGDLAKMPHGPRLARLRAPAACAAVELLRGTLMRHSVIVYRDDLPRSRWSIRFDGDDWHKAVPLRLPHTLCLHERLPPGAAAALVNQSHSYPDLVLLLGPDELRLFDAIDGRRTIVEIARHASLGLDAPARRERVKAFFERLWWYDQVVFDLSLQSSSELV